MSAVQEDPRDRTGDAARYDPDAWRRAFAGIVEGRAEALEQLYDLAAERVFGLAAWRLGSADDAADVVHDVFVRVAETGSRLTAVRDPRAWLLAVAHRVAIDHTRRKARRATAALDDNPYLEAPAEDPGRRLDARAAAAALDRLPGRQREAIYLRHCGGCSFAEIVRIAGVPTFTAASRYRLGIKKLQAILRGKR